MLPWIVVVEVRLRGFVRGERVVGCGWIAGVDVGSTTPGLRSSELVDGMLWMMHAVSIVHTMLTIGFQARVTGMRCQLVGSQLERGLHNPKFPCEYSAGSRLLQDATTNWTELNLARRVTRRTRLAEKGKRGLDSDSGAPLMRLGSLAGFRRISTPPR
jgi:hypothetical protein